MEQSAKRKTEAGGGSGDGPDIKKKLSGKDSDLSSEDHFDDDIMSDFSEADFVEERSPSLHSSGDSGKGSEDASSGAREQGFYGLPDVVPQLLKKFRHIDSLYDWQERLLQKLQASEKNVIYCVPTSGGKTLVAELMILRELLSSGRDAILVLPFVSIVQEKLRSLRPFAESLGFVVEEYAGSRGCVPVKKRRFMRTVYLATIEKANVVVTSLFEGARLHEIGLFVVDELHMIGDGTTRGATLETLIVKTRLAAAKSGCHIRFLGMSATLNNFADLSLFLDAEVIRDTFRPVVLKEYLKFGANLYDITDMNKGFEIEDMPLVRQLEGKELPEDPENLRTLVGEVIPSKSCLVFCPTKKHCENVVLSLSRHLANRAALLLHKKPEKERLVRCIRQSNAGSICPVLLKTLPFGLAYHHSGLTPDERQIIEEGFSKQVISVIVCTSTLAAGVNLPAERVIIRDPRVGREFLTKAQYQQICGRAGRAGLCSHGESILICTQKDAKGVQKLLETPLPSCVSSLKDVPNGLSAFILTLLRLQLATSADDLCSIIVGQTLSGIQCAKEPLQRQVRSSLQQLEQLSLVSHDASTGGYTVSDVGKGVVRSLIDVSKSLSVYEELKKAQSAISLSNLLHLIFLTTLLMEERDLPFSPDNEVLMSCFNDLSADEQRSAEMFGLNLGVVCSYLRPDAKPTVRIRRFYVTLLVYEVWTRRTDLSVMAAKHKMQRGTLYSILGQAASAANALLRFVEETKGQLWSFRRLLPEVCEALTYCCVPELMPLMQLPDIRVPRARQLYAAGFRDVISIARLKSHQDLTGKIDRLNAFQAKTLIRAARHVIRSQRDELEQQVTEMNVAAAAEEESDATTAAEDSFLQSFDV